MLDFSNFCRGCKQWTLKREKFTLQMLYSQQNTRWVSYVINPSLGHKQVRTEIHLQFRSKYRKYKSYFNLENFHWLYCTNYLNLIANREFVVPTWIPFFVIPPNFLKFCFVFFCAVTFFAIFSEISAANYSETIQLPAMEYRQRWQASRLVSPSLDLRCRLVFLIGGGSVPWTPTPLTISENFVTPFFAASSLANFSQIAATCKIQHPVGGGGLRSVIYDLNA